MAWRREHQVALGCSFVLGFVLGMLAGTHTLNPYDYHTRWPLWCSAGNCTNLRPGYLLAVIFWSTLCGLVGATIVYIRQLLRP